MAILFDWYENPVSPDQPKKKRFHPRIAYNGQVDTDEMRSKIQSRCTLNEVDRKSTRLNSSHPSSSRMPSSA